MLAPHSINVSTDWKETGSRNTDVVELTLLLVARQMAALERAAGQRGLTVAQLTRRLIGDFLQQNAVAKAAAVDGLLGPQPEGVPKPRDLSS
jgi:hypothetical protein